MRFLLTLLACLMLVVSAFNGSAQAAGAGCSETIEQVAVHVAGDCDDLPADADQNDRHCHTGCHGHHVAAPIPGQASVPAIELARAYAPAGHTALGAHQPNRTLRPPQA